MNKKPFVCALIYSFFASMLVVNSTYADTSDKSSVDKSTVDKNLISKITLQSDGDAVQLESHPFKAKVEHNVVSNITDKLNKQEPITIFGDKQSWTALEGDTAGTHLLRFSVSAQQFTKGSLTVEGAEKTSLYLNNQKISGGNEYSLELLNQDYRALLMVSGVSDWQALSIEWTDKSKSTDTEDAQLETAKESTLAFGDDKANKRPSMRHFYDSETVGMLNVSPDGEWLIWSKRSYSDLGGDKPRSIVEIRKLDSKQVVYRFQAMSPRNIAWRADSEALVFLHQSSLYELNTKTWALNELASDLSDIRSIEYLSDNELILTWHKAEEKPHKFTKRYRAVEDRWSYWRGNLQIHKFDMNSGLFKQVSKNKLSSSILDVDTKSRRAIIARRPIDYAQPPHGLTQLFEINLDSSEEKALGEFRTFNSAQYHEEGMIIIAGPSFGNNVGLNIGNEETPNDYDGQMYLMDKSGDISALSKDFNPAIGQARVLANGNILLSVTDQDRTQLYEYDFDDERFSKINTNVEVVNGFAVSDQKRPELVYKGTSATIPERVYTKRLSAKKQTVLFDSRSQDFANIDLIELKDWDYTTEAGQLIDGRVYYPANFDANNKYPAIIYYYAGTVPVGRNFTGRYPFSWYASMGYVVYVLQPSGAIGYGQEFSARHVNAWGIRTADEIIESTQAFVDAHTFVDKDRLGNMGASYGGFMTMYLATRTDMFAASISHAGISNLTSYWGHGWWGYGYSGIATRGSWPWNRSDLYVEQSPIFAADKVSTPMLLVHGDADTNVPVGESHQMYTALMLLGKDVELVEFQGDDHHVNSRERRFRWWQTKLAYFDMKLKDESLWWTHLYPKAEE